MMLISIGILCLCFAAMDVPAIPLNSGSWLIIFNNRYYAVPVNVPLNYADKF